VPSVSFFPPHHNPHGTPLRCVDRLDNLWYLVDKTDGSGDVVEDFDISDLFPGHWDIFQQFVYGMGSVF
jgi:hypothetical protein